MNVYRVPISLDPLLVAVGNILLQAKVPDPDKVETVRWLRADLDARDFSREKAAPTAYYRAPLPETQARARVIAPPGFEVRGCHYHPAGGGEGWHTNGDAPGWRVYVIRPMVPPVDVASRVLGEGVGHHCVWNDPGVWGFANVFKVGPGTWHAVDAKTPRMAIGLLVPGSWAQLLLRRAGVLGEADNASV